MKLKKKNILAIAILAVAGLFGTASAVVNQKVNEEPVVEKAEADESKTVTRVYIEDQVTTTPILAIESISFADGYDHTTWRAFLTSYLGARSTYTTTSGESMPSTKGWSYMSNSETEKYLLCPTGSKNFTMIFPEWVTAFSYKAVGNNWWNWFDVNGSAVGLHSGWGIGKKVNSYIYNDSGWKMNANLDNTAQTNTWGDITITAKAIDSNTSTQIASKSITMSKYYLISSQTYTITDYDFGGWYTTSALTTEYSTLLTDNDTIYAKETPSSYTITYDRNLNSGLQETQSKEPGENVNAYTPGLSPIDASGWSPSTFKRFVHWNTTYDDKGTSYASGATISTDETFTLYYIEDWYNYRYKVDSGSWITLNSNTTNLPDGVQVQFTPSSAQELPLGGILTFEYSTDGGTSWSTLNSISYEDGGNYDTTTGIKLATYDTIFLKLTTSGTYTCWVPGISERTILVTSSSTGTTGTSYSMIGKSDSETVTTAAVYVEKGQYVRRCYAGTPYNTWYEGGTYSTGTSACFENVTGNDAVLCTVTGVYTIYNQKGSGSWWNIWVERHDELSAGFLAQKFNSVISSICTDVVGGTKGLSQLQAAWGSNSSSALYYHFNGQSSPTLAYFSEGSSTENTDILACVERYDYIENKYGTTALPDFLSRDNGYKAAIRDYSPINLIIDDEDNLSTIIIIAASSVALLSVTSLSILVIKKRKNKEE